MPVRASTFGRSHFNHPLGSRFEEMDSVVFFDNVLVPWERIFLLGNVELGNGYATGTQSDSHTGHQILNRCLVKSEFILGLADLIVDTLGSGTIPHVQEQVAELITYRDVLRSCVRAAEADATMNQYGMMSPDINALRAGRTVFGRSMYPRMVEIIQLLGTGALMALPAEADFDSGIGPGDRAVTSPPIRQMLAIEQSCSTWRGTHRVALSAGGQVLYERMFGGNPVRNTIALFQNYNKEPFRKRVRNFLAEEDWP